MNLRIASMDDARLLYEWRNDPLTRASCFSTAEIDFASHCLWLACSLASDTRKLYVAVIEGVPVGTTRCDFADGVSQLSWTVAPEARGKGHGMRMVRLLAERIPGPLRAEIKAGNAASERIALAAGMTLADTQDGLRRYRRA